MKMPSLHILFAALGQRRRRRGRGEGGGHHRLRLGLLQPGGSNCRVTGQFELLLWSSLFSSTVACSTFVLNMRRKSTSAAAEQCHLLVGRQPGVHLVAGGGGHLQQHQHHPAQAKDAEGDDQQAKKYLQPRGGGVGGGGEDDDHADHQRPEDVQGASGQLQEGRQA